MNMRTGNGVRHGIDTRRKISELIREYPQLAQLLAEMGIECADCLASDVDTLQDVVRMYRLDLDALLAKMGIRDDP